jgi:two-component system CheB/CheR fusion protein
MSRIAVNSGVKTAKPPFFVVGVGASAGGLEAFTELLQNLPVDTNMAFVLVQHLAPTHASLLTQLLSKTTTLSIAEVVHGTAVLPGHVYVMPPNVEMMISKGILLLSERKKTFGQNTSIDVFFRSLAEDRKECAIGVILSGTDSDGVLGLEIIKAEGGFTFSQDEASAKFKDMPRKAAATGAVDFILPPKAIAAKLSHLPKQVFVPYFKAIDKQELSPKEEKALPKILQILKVRTGMDFTFYKNATILRRIARRMILLRTDDIEVYFRHLREHPNEVQALRKDLLINVTSFFRDPASFELLKKKVFPEIVKRSKGEAAIRIWVPGCSTGNEAYSIAMALDEFLGHKTPHVKIFATDVSEDVLEIARRGTYPENIKLDVSPERLERYFTKADGGYQIKKFIRELCVFAPHNMLSDPPYSDLDIVSCRNVMIYMEPELQKKAMLLFHYALKPRGFLVLGGSETVGIFSDSFSTVDKKYKIYTKKQNAKTARNRRFDVGHFRKKPAAAEMRRPESLATGAFDARKEATGILDRKKFKDGVLVTETMEIVEFYGQTYPYIRPAAGQASFGLLQMVREALLPDLYILIYRAKKEKSPLRVLSLSAGNSKFVDLEIIPIKAPASGELYFLILFEEPQKSPRSGKRTAPRLEDENKKLKNEILLAKESLMAIMKEQIGISEEFRCQNEEIQSSNEEFQSSNEELETAKEELQSTNEELMTVNAEIEVRNTELSLLNDDLNNLILSIHTPVVLVDANLKIRRFTGKAGKSLGLRTADVGQRITDVGIVPRVKNLEAIIRQVLDTLEQYESEIADDDGNYFLLRIRPYIRKDGRADGAILVFVDVTEMRRDRAKIEEAKKYSEAVVETLWEPLVALDADLRVKSVNQSFCDFFRVSKKETIGKLIYDLGNGQWNIPRLQQLLEELVVKDNSFHNLQMEHTFPGIGHKTMLLNAHKLHLKANENRQERAIVLAFQDISGRIEAEAVLMKAMGALKDSEAQYRTLFDTMDEGFCVVEVLLTGDGIPADYRFLEVNSAFEKQSGLKAVAGQTVRGLLPLIEAQWIDQIGGVALTGKASRFQARSEELARWFDVYTFRVGRPDERKVAVLFNDITERRRIEEDLKRVHHELEQFTSIASHDLQEPLRKIVIYTEMLLSPRSEADRTKTLDRLIKAAARMKSLIEALLDFSRADRKRGFLSVDLNGVVKKVLEDLEAGGQAAVSVGALPIVQGDPILLEQLFSNMIGNSLKYKKKDVASVISITCRTKNLHHEIRIKDNGIGFDIKYADRIFKPLERLHSHSSEYPGAGIGLATCLKIVRHHKGGISANSMFGKGATFVVTLPVDQYPFLDPTSVIDRRMPATQP